MRIRRDSKILKIVLPSSAFASVCISVSLFLWASTPAAESHHAKGKSAALSNIQWTDEPDSNRSLALAEGAFKHPRLIPDALATSLYLSLLGTANLPPEAE